MRSLLNWTILAMRRITGASVEETSVTAPTLQGSEMTAEQLARFNDTMKTLGVEVVETTPNLYKRQLLVRDHRSRG